jgi:hypothetical protein
MYHPPHRSGVHTCVHNDADTAHTVAKQHEHVVLPLACVLPLLSGCELSVLRQRALLRAAVLGRAFCKTDFPQLLLVNTCRQLRVLNALRDPSVGLPLTLAQLQELTAPQLVSR